MDKIEKLKEIESNNQVDYDMVDKINEIIEAVNHLQRLEILKRNLDNLPSNNINK